MLDQSRFFHVGIRVTDIEAAMAEVGKHAGVTWASVQDRPMSVWLPGTGPAVLQLALTYSIEGPVHLELLQGPTGSIWDGRDVPGAHHFGYWSDDVGADTEQMLADGWTLETRRGRARGRLRAVHLRAVRRRATSSSRCRSPASRASSGGGQAGSLTDPVS